MSKIIKRHCTKEIDYSLSRNSYNNFFMSKDSGLLHAISKMFPICGSSKNTKIELEDYSVIVPKYNECIYIQRYLSYLAKIKLKITTTIGSNSVTSNVTYCNIPVMVNDSYFVINGTKKVMIYQLAKTGGIYYDVNNENKMVNSKLVSTSGSRIELRINHRESINIYVNSSKKILLTDFFKLFSSNKINTYIENYNPESISLVDKFSNSIVRYMFIFGKSFKITVKKEHVIVYCLKADCDKYLFCRHNTKSKYSNKTLCLCIPLKDIANCFSISSVTVNNNEVLSVSQHIDVAILEKLVSLHKNKSGIDVHVIFFEKGLDIVANSFISYSGKCDKSDANKSASFNDLEDTEDDLKEDDEYEDDVEDSKIDHKDEYSSEYGYLNLEYRIDQYVRDSINKKLGIVYSKSSPKLTEEDVFNFIKFFAINTQKDFVDKQNYDRLDYKKVKKAEDFVSSIIIRSIERLQSNSKCVVIDKNGKSNIDDFLNSYSSSNEIRKIFSSHPLVQFLDQVNPLAELSHKRRISIFNLINVEKYQVSLEGRDVNSSYYGRLCTAETPEGTNIGLINSAACNAQIDVDGFITSRFYLVSNCIISSDIVDLKSNQEYEHYICSYRSSIKTNTKILCRHKNEFIEVDSSMVTLMEYSNNCIFSISASLVPFPQHNDAKRILMGSNMLRQSVPLIIKQQTVVGTGFEKIGAEVSEHSIKIPKNSVIMYASNKIVTYMCLETGKVNKICGNLYPKTNMKTYNNSTCNVTNNQEIHSDTCALDGYGIKNGELVCGQNILVAFMSFYGGNYEDGIVISEGLIKKSYFESIHAFEVDVKAKEIDVNVVEKITKDNPNEAISKLDYLDSDGVIKVGTNVVPGTIIVSRIVPIETKCTSEDQVLSIIFGKKISDYKDISHKANFDAYGTVISARKFSRNNSDNNVCNEFIYKDHNIQVCSELKSIIEYVGRFHNIDNYKQFTNKIKYIYASDLDIVKSFINMIMSDYDECTYKSAKKIYNSKMKNIDKYIKTFRSNLDEKYSQNIDNNVSEHVRVLIANRRTIGEGDKMAGRHGNKGVVSSVKPIEDMPFMDDGTPIDIIFNSIGIPNRLNIGQILETYFGYLSFKFTKDVGFLIKTDNVEEAKKKIKAFMQLSYHRDKSLTEEDIFVAIKSNQYIALKSAAFEKISIQEIQDAIKLCTADDGKSDGCLRLRSGYDGKKIIRKVFVGLKSIMKLIHMAKDKISSRETGGYSTILQQPLPRKINGGGQRMGEMELWALEAHGVSNVINESLGSKSDDRSASNLMYEGILNGKFSRVSCLSETINVIIKYINGGCMNLRFFRISKENT